jgi:two-component system, chemotaxis family, chemotaxis protein CheY
MRSTAAREGRSVQRASSPDILVVDDDATLREGLIMFFRLEGRSAMGASNGAEALFLLGKEVWPGVILLDLNMPTMNGWDFVSALGRMPELPRIPIAIMSGVASDSDAPPCETDAGFFRKPVNFDALLAAVDRHLPPRAIPRRW